VSPSGKKPSSPFAVLAKLRDELPEGTPVPEATPVPEPASASPLAGKIVVARTRKGRGGKTVTLVSGMSARGEALDALARDLRQALGCGAAVEDGERIVVQGDQVSRVRELLASMGARRIVVGS
jgi:translation initiation factor 1